VHEHDVNSEQGWERTTIERRKKTQPETTTPVVHPNPLYFHQFFSVFWWLYFVVSLESLATLDKTDSFSAA
jgi:hypothetical protein